MSVYVCDHMQHPDTERKPNQCVKCGVRLEPEQPTERAFRSREWEEIFLTGAARRAGLDPEPWIKNVRDRVDSAGAKEYRDSWADRSLREYVTEIDEEGQDLGGWPMLCGQTLYARGIGPDRLELALDILQRIAALGAQERLLKLQLEEALGLD